MTINHWISGYHFQTKQYPTSNGYDYQSFDLGVPHFSHIFHTKQYRSQLTMDWGEVGLSPLWTHAGGPSHQWLTEDTEKFQRTSWLDILRPADFGLVLRELLQETPIFDEENHGFGVRSSLQSSDLCHFEASYWHSILGSPLLIFCFSHIELDTWGWNTTRFLWLVKPVGTIADPNWIPVSQAVALSTKC
jgi:hypothetical protein